MLFCVLVLFPISQDAYAIAWTEVMKSNSWKYVIWENWACLKLVNPCLVHTKWWFIVAHIRLVGRFQATQTNHSLIPWEHHLSKWWFLLLVLAFDRLSSDYLDLVSINMDLDIHHFKGTMDLYIDAEVPICGYIYISGSSLVTWLIRKELQK